MSIVSFSFRPILGEIQLGTAELNSDVQTQLPLSQDYARTQAKTGYQLSARSEPKFYNEADLPRKPVYPPYGARQVFTCTEATLFPSTTFIPPPLTLPTPPVPSNSVFTCHFDQVRSFLSFVSGDIHVTGFNGGGGTNLWSFALEFENGEETTTLVPVGAFSIIVPMTAQAIIDINTGIYPLIPGVVICPANSSGFISKLEYALY